MRGPKERIDAAETAPAEKPAGAEKGMVTTMGTTMETDRVETGTAEISRLQDMRLEEMRLEQHITGLMLEVGVPAHLKGYQYLRAAILMTHKDMEIVGSVTKLLYPELAKKFKTTEQKVERAIRNAIEVSWTRGNAETFERLFGYSVLTGKQGRPTNSEYIAQLADWVGLEIREENSQALESIMTEENEDSLVL